MGPGLQIVNHKNNGSYAKQQTEDIPMALFSFFLHKNSISQRIYQIKWAVCEIKLFNNELKRIFKQLHTNLIFSRFFP